MDGSPHGELLALSAAGTAHPLGAAVTVVGSGPGCDVVLDAPGVEPVHCLLVVTPAGPAVRSLCPDQTAVNGAPTAARLLVDGDELHVGPVAFRVRLPEPLVPLCVAPPDDVELQPEALAALICARQEQFARWAAELADKREEVRQLRDRVATSTAAARRAAGDRLAEADRQASRAKADRARVKRLAVRLAGRLRRKYAADHAELIAGRKQLRAEWDRFHAQRERQAHAWDLLTAGQKRLVADRQAADAVLAAERNALDERAAELHAEAAARTANQVRAESRVEHLLAEVARLDARAAAGRAAVDRLEQDRAALRPAPEFATPSLPLPDHVPLALTPMAAAGQLLAELTLRDREVARTEAALTAVREELARRAAVLHDDRLVLAEQVAAIAHARHAWQASECQVVAELEDCARALGRQEFAVAGRERQVAAREAAADDRAAELGAARVKLEGWLTLLAAHEAGVTADRDRLLAEAEAKRASLLEWERTLGELFRRWCDEHEAQTARVREEAAGWRAERDRLAETSAKLDRDAAALADRAVRLAACSTAVEQAAGELAGGPQAERRLRVLRAGWERQFRHHAEELEARRQAVAAEADRADERCRELGRRAADAADRERAAVALERQAEAARLARGRELDDRAVTLSFEAARTDRTRQELDAVRGEVEAVARRLIGDPAPALPAGGSRVGVLALEAA